MTIEKSKILGQQSDQWVLGSGVEGEAAYKGRWVKEIWGGDDDKYDYTHFVQKK